MYRISQNNKTLEEEDVLRKHLKNATSYDTRDSDGTNGYTTKLSENQDVRYRGMSPLSPQSEVPQFINPDSRTASTDTQVTSPLKVDIVNVKNRAMHARNISESSHNLMLNLKGNKSILLP